MAEGRDGMVCTVRLWFSGIFSASPQDVFMLREFVHESLRFLYAVNLVPGGVSEWFVEVLSN